MLARFSRLLVDPNRHPLHRDLFRAVADGQLVRLNAALSAQERVLRLERYYRAYHFAVDRALARGRSRAPVLLSLHTFTPLYEGQARAVALGVLFNKHEAAARALGEHLAAEFSGLAYNEPWSGKEGLMYAAESHAERHGLVPIELEVRQDLALDAGYRARLVNALVRYFSSNRPSSSAKLQGR